MKDEIKLQCSNHGCRRARLQGPRGTYEPYINGLRGGSIKCGACDAAVVEVEHFFPAPVED